MFSKFLKIALIIVALSYLLSASAALAIFDWELEEKYPTLPGTHQTITSESSLGETIHYFMGFAILIAGVVVMISLIIAGLLYITSIGRPEAMSQARGKIYNSFIGLLIILGSYLILLTVNPQLVVTKITREPVKSGVFLLTEKGFDDLTGPDVIDDLERKGELQFLNYTLPDLRDEHVLGPLEPYDGAPCGTGGKNFTNFKLAGIAIWKSQDQDYYTRLTFYPEANFGGDKDKIKKYSFEGSAQAGEIALSAPPSGEGEETKDPNLRKLKFDKARDECFGNPLHPFLSVKKETIGKGVFLYTEDGQDGPEKFIQASVDDLTDFNDKTRYIKINNGEGDSKKDFLVALHDYQAYTGRLRLFFENKKARKIWNGTAYEDSTEPIGNITNQQITKTDVLGPWGYVKKASSVSVYKIAPEPSVCNQVLLCTEPGGEESYGMDFCVSYEHLEDGEKEATGYDAQVQASDAHIVAIQALPIWRPKNLPKDITFYVCIQKTKTGGGKTVDEIVGFTDAGTDCTKGEKKKIDKFKFNDKIRSLRVVDGSCAVVLFENSVEDEVKCKEKCPFPPSPPSPPNPKCELCWDYDHPGKRSQIFERKNLDLMDDEIGDRTSAIAIFPIINQ